MICSKSGKKVSGDFLTKYSNIFKENKMIGAIAGDIVGSVYEARPIKSKDFPLFDSRCTFTDDSVLTIAVAWAILSGRAYRDAVLELGRLYPDAGYGGSFIRWLMSEKPQPYNSWGNGAAMGISSSIDWQAHAHREARSQPGICLRSTGGPATVRPMP